MFDRSVLWYHTHKVKPKWSRKMQKVAVVGNHKFFEEKIDQRVNSKEKES